jgi:hypothetical protein
MMHQARVLRGARAEREVDRLLMHVIVRREQQLRVVRRNGTLHRWLGLVAGPQRQLLAGHLVALIWSIASNSNF